MRYVFVILLLSVLAAGGIFLVKNISPQRDQEEERSVFRRERQSGMKIESVAFGHNQYIPAKFTCDGEDINPPLRVSDVPEDTKSLVLIMDDPDAPGGTWVHWTVWNITSETREIRERSVPSGGVEGVTSFQRTGYGGPCPPSGTHRYFFKLFALDTALELPASGTVGELEEAMSGHILDEAQLIGLYQRK